MRHVYLDHQSATPVLPEAAAAMLPHLGEQWGNPSSLHQWGMAAREAVAAAREKMAAFIGAESPEDLIFTSDGTESANLAVKGAAWAGQRRGNHVIVSEAEHPAVLNSIEFLEARGFRATRIKVNGEGIIDPADIKAAITDKTILIAAHLANHDIGTIQPAAEIGEIANEAGVPLFVDAEAAAGWMPIDVEKLGATFLSFSPHRFYGPKGVGMLYRRRRARLTSLIHGGMQENNLRAGVENVAGIVGAGVAVEIAGREGLKWSAHCRELQQRLWNGLQSAIPHVRLNGPAPGLMRSPINLNVSVRFIDSESQALLCDAQGIAIAGSTNCVSKSLRISHVLAAIGLPPDWAQGAVILSPGKDTSVEDIEYVLERFAKIAAKLRSMSPEWGEYEKARNASE